MISRSGTLAIATVVSMSVHVAHAAPPVVYDCKWGSEKARLNFTDHIATYAGKDIELGEGILFGFRTPDGAYLSFDVKFSMDVVRFDRPSTMSGKVSLQRDGVDDKVMPVRCTLRR